MCDPVTLSIAATALSATGSLVGGYSALAQGNAAYKVAGMNAKMDERAARDALARGDEAAAKHYREVSGLKGEQIAAMSAAGLDVSFGSALQVQTDTAMLASEDAGIILDNAAREAEGFRISAWNNKVKGETARSQGRAAALGSVFEAAGTILGGAQQVKGLQAKYGTSTGGGASGSSYGSTGNFMTPGV